MEILLFLFSFFVTFAGTGLVRHLALKGKVMDIPGPRSSHKIPTPRGGGLAIVVCSLFLGAYFYFSGLVQFGFIMSITIGGVIIAAIGLIDDIREVSPWLRLIIHFCAAGIGMFFMKYYGGITHFIFPPDMPWLDLFFSLFIWVWLINLYNFMDGIDGIAATEAICVFLAASLILFFKGDSFSYLLIMFAASCSGFILWNLPPARIFMGDVGSGFLGYVMGALVIFGNGSGKLNIWVWLILLGVFLVDSTFTLIRRILKGEKWYGAHCSHTYQRASRIWKSHGTITLSVLAINCFWLFPLAAVANKWPNVGSVIMTLSFIPLIFIAVYFIKRKERSDAS